MGTERYVYLVRTRLEPHVSRRALRDAVPVSAQDGLALRERVALTRWAGVADVVVGTTDQLVGSGPALQLVVLAMAEQQI
jgi:hypothetical protein